MNMLLINLLIAIILDTYKEVQKAEESREAVPWMPTLGAPGGQWLEKGVYMTSCDILCLHGKMLAT